MSAPATAAAMPPTRDLADWPEWLLGEERRRLQLVCVLFVLGPSAYFLNDLRFDGVQAWLQPLGRAAYIACFLAALVAIARDATPRTIRGLVAAGTLGIALHTALRYGIGIGHLGPGSALAADIVLLFGLFMLPQDERVQVGAAVTIVAAALFDFAVHKGLPREELIGTALSLVTVTALGWAAARTLRSELRERWETLCELAEMRALVPMCAWCKSIRGTDGGWEDLEDFLRRQASTELTHGVCPACLARMEHSGAA
jgi:hypothetical protein